MVTWTFDAQVEYVLPADADVDRATLGRRRGSGLQRRRPATSSSSSAAAATLSATRRRPALSIVPVPFTPANDVALAGPRTAAAEGSQRVPHQDAGDDELRPPRVPRTPATPDTPTAELAAIVPPLNEAYTAQRATLRHVGSLGHMRPLAALDGAAETAAQLLLAPEREMSTRWARGRVQIVLHGEGGEDGGELCVFGADDPVLAVSLAAIADPPWPLDGVQHTHRSLSHRAHALSLLLPALAHAPDLDPDADLPAARAAPATPATPGKALSDVRRSLAKLGRLRSRTLTGSSVPNPSARAAGSSAAIAERHLHLAFASDRESKNWFALLRALAHAAPRRVHRRLDVWVLDLLETAPVRGVAADEGASGVEASVDTHSKDGTARSAGRGVRPGWAARDMIRVELLVGRTAWTSAEGRGTPFWGEQLCFEGMPEFSSCDLVLFRQPRSRLPAPFGVVRLPLVSDFAAREDERFPILALDGAVIGELRLAVSYTEVAVLPRGVYLEQRDAGVDLTAISVSLLYRLAIGGYVEGIAGTMTRLALAGGSVLPTLLEMCSFEARAAGATLFRGTTPLTKTLEAVMRHLCVDFLEAGIGPTIRYVAEARVTVKIHADAAGRVISASGIEAAIKLVERCWRDLYSTRHHFPDVLRHVFAHLFKEVKDAHEDQSDKLRYKAVSCFVFLRLIGPALMRPHLFALSDGLLPPEQQRALTLVARVLHALAFFSERDTARDPELGRFQPFIRANNETMVDYLASFATPLDDWQAKPAAPSVLSNFFAARAARLPPLDAEAMPTLTPGGPVDTSAELAVVHAKLWERRGAPRPNVYARLAVARAKGSARSDGGSGSSAAESSAGAESSVEDDGSERNSADDTRDAGKLDRGIGTGGASRSGAQSAHGAPGSGDGSHPSTRTSVGAPVNLVELEAVLWTHIERVHNATSGSDATALGDATDSDPGSRASTPVSRNTHGSEPTATTATTQSTLATPVSAAAPVLGLPITTDSAKPALAARVDVPADAAVVTSPLISPAKPVTRAAPRMDRRWSGIRLPGTTAPQDIDRADPLKETEETELRHASRQSVSQSFSGVHPPVASPASRRPADRARTPELVRPAPAPHARGRPFSPPPSPVLPDPAWAQSPGRRADRAPAGAEPGAAGLATLASLGGLAGQTAAGAWVDAGRRAGR